MKWLGFTSVQFGVVWLGSFALFVLPFGLWVWVGCLAGLFVLGLVCTAICTTGHVATLDFFSESVQISRKLREKDLKMWSLFPLPSFSQKLLDILHSANGSTSNRTNNLHACGWEPPTIQPWCGFLHHGEAVSQGSQHGCRNFCPTLVLLPKKGENGHACDHFF